VWGRECLVFKYGKGASISTTISPNSALGLPHKFSQKQKSKAFKQADFTAFCRAGFLFLRDKSQYNHTKSNKLKREHLRDAPL
jgi:hypothetical protein